MAVLSAAAFTEHIYCLEKGRSQELSGIMVYKLSYNSAGS